MSTTVNWKAGSLTGMLVAAWKREKVNVT